MLRPGRNAHHDRFFDLASIIGVWDRAMRDLFKDHETVSDGRQRTTRSKL